MFYTLKDEEESLEYSILEFLDNYQSRHSDEQTMRLVKAMLMKKEICILPEKLKTVEKEELSKELERLIVEKAHEEEYKEYHLEKYLSIFRPYEKKKPSYKLKKAAITGTIFAMTSLSGFMCGASNKSSEQASVQSVPAISTDIVTAPEEEMTTQESIEELQRKKEALLKAKKKRLKLEKQKVLTTFSKCKSVKEIKVREKELENLKLTKKDKIYKDCPLSAEVQHFIYEQSIVNDIPVDFLFAIIDVETRGAFNSSGSQSYNKWNNTYDLGLTQQNSKSSLLNFCNHYNIKYEKAFDLVKNNDFVNIGAAFLQFKEIQYRIKDFNPYEYAGCYNGWLNWREKEISLQYVELFTNAYDNIYTKHHQVEEKKTLTKSKKN